MRGSDHVVCVGISYEKADLELRGRFALSNESVDEILQIFKDKGENLFVVSTCNRTELYSWRRDAQSLIDVLCKYSDGSYDEFDQVGYVKKGDDAVRHILELGTGLKSQILGDFEIIGQIKSAASKSKKIDVLNGQLERLLNLVLQTSKEVKNKTCFSSHSASTSYAAVQWVKENVIKSEIRILLYGAGDIGKHTCANLVKHFHSHDITVINRTKEKAVRLSQKYNVRFEEEEQFGNIISNADVLIVATNANDYTVTPEKINGTKGLNIVDLSVPTNVAPECAELATLVSLDELTEVVNSAVEKRQNQIPTVLRIVDENLVKYRSWLKERKYEGLVKAFKNELVNMQQNAIDIELNKSDETNLKEVEAVSNRMIHILTKKFVTHLKSANIIEAVETSKVINSIFELDTDASN